MTPMIKKLANLFGALKSNKDDPEVESDAEVKDDSEIHVEAEISPVEMNESATAENNSSPDPSEPLVRTVIQAPVLAKSSNEVESDDVLIKAEPAREGDSCKFMVNRPLFAGHSWYFPNFESAAGSPVAEKIFSFDEVETLLIQDSTAILTKKNKSDHDWKPLAVKVGQAIRETILLDVPMLSDSIVKEMPTEDGIRDGIQKVIDEEVNPGVAGHGGKIRLLNVMGNTVTIEMGGGCQGCSAADLTLKQGIHNAFRKAVPFVGAICDETDHSSGTNPYFS